jgi:hypothetical protein
MWILLGHWTETAWNDISPESIAKVFKKCCVSSDMNGVQQEENHEET